MDMSAPGPDHPPESHAAPAAQQPPPLPYRMRRMTSAMLALILLNVMAWWIFYFYERHKDGQWTDDAFIETDIVRISPKVSGEVVQLNVNDNTHVKKGDVLLVVDPRDYQDRVDEAAAALATARGQVTQADASLVKAQAAVGPSQAAESAAKTEMDRAAADDRRYTAMDNEGVSRTQMDAIDATARSSADNFLAAQERTAAAEADIDVAKAACATARSQVDASEAALRTAQLQLEYSRVIAPVMGRVTKKEVAPGDYLATGEPVFSIVPDHVWVIANFKEVQLTDMKAGQPAAIYVDAYPDLKLTGHIDSLQAGTGSRFNLLPPENATGNFVKVVQRVPVKIMFDESQADLLKPGLSVEVEVKTK